MICLPPIQRAAWHAVEIVLSICMAVDYRRHALYRFTVTAAY
jgi:hypothetical protein